MLADTPAFAIWRPLPDISATHINLYTKRQQIAELEREERGAGPASVLLHLNVEQARCYEISETTLELHGDPARVTLKVPEI